MKPKQNKMPVLATAVALTPLELNGYKFNGRHTIIAAERLKKA